MSPHYRPLRACACRAPRTTTADLPGRTGSARLDGKADHDQRGGLEDALARSVKEGMPCVIVDLPRLLSRDSTRPDALLPVRFTVYAAAIAPVVAASFPQTRRLRQITGADEIFTRPRHRPRPHRRRRTLQNEARHGHP